MEKFHRNVCWMLGELRFGIGLLTDDLFDFVELAKDRSIGRVFRVHRTQQRGARELARLVDADRNRVLLGDVELDPAAALWNDPARVQLLLTGV